MQLTPPVDLTKLKDTDLDDLMRAISGMFAIEVERFQNTIRVDTKTGLVVVLQRDSINVRGGDALYEDWEERVEKWRDGV